MVGCDLIFHRFDAAVVYKHRPDSMPALVGNRSRPAIPDLENQNRAIPDIPMQSLGRFGSTWVAPRTETIPDIFCEDNADGVVRPDREPNSPFVVAMPCLLVVAMPCLLHIAFLGFGFLGAFMYFVRGKRPTRMNSAPHLCSALCRRSLRTSCANFSRSMASSVTSNM